MGCDEKHRPDWIKACTVVELPARCLTYQLRFEHLGDSDVGLTYYERAVNISIVDTKGTCWRNVWPIPESSTSPLKYKYQLDSCVLNMQGKMVVHIPKEIPRNTYNIRMELSYIYPDDYRLV
jgi:hypothetical protein